MPCQCRAPPLMYLDTQGTHISLSMQALRKRPSALKPQAAVR